jgi:hypothetical protein
VALTSTQTLHRRLERLQSVLHRQLLVPLRQAGAAMGPQIHPALEQGDPSVVPQDVSDHEEPHPRSHRGGSDRRLLPGIQ